MSTINDLKAKSLRALGYTGSIDDMYRSYLRAISGSSLNSVDDLEKLVLGGSGSINDRWKAHLDISGIRGRAMDNMLREYWSTLGAGALGTSYLFRNNEVGVWYDPSDLSTMFQDSAGTTAAVVGQPVGLMLDKSKGLVLGPELVTNGGFDTDTAWTKGTGWSITSGYASITNAAATSNLSQAVGYVLNSFYQVDITLTITSGSLSVLIGNGVVIKSLTSSGTYSIKGAATGGTPGTLYLQAAAGTTCSVGLVSSKALPGYHATQSTSTARPILGTNLVDYDGVDDATLMTSGGGGTTGFFLCAAVRPDGGAGAVRTIWSDAGTNTGYIVRLNASNQLEIAAGNGTTYTLAATTDTLTVGTTYVVTAWDDGINLNVQVNSGTAGTAARPVVSAGTTTATIGKDNGAATGMFNGGIYPLIYVKNGENVGAADRTAVKAYVAGKAGVTL